MLSLIVAVALSQVIEVGEQSCTATTDSLFVHVVLEEPTYGRKLFNFSCTEKKCVGSSLKLAKVGEAQKVGRGDMNPLVGLTVLSRQGTMVVLDWGPSQFTIDVKEGRVIRTANGERAEGKCAPYVDLSRPATR